MRHAVVLAMFVACRADAAPPPSAPPPARAAVNKPAPASATDGACRAHTVVAGVDDRSQPDEMAGCPDPLEFMRGNGLGAARLPAVDPKATTPPWDVAGARAYACAYACAPDGATAQLLAWSIYEDARPLRNHYAAYVVADAAHHAWTVVVMYRHAVNGWWNVDTSPHRPSHAIARFDHPPTKDELDAALAATVWPTGDDRDGFRRLAGGTIAASWPAAAK
jgi:hypothetical protein